MNCPLCDAHEATVVYSVAQAPVTCTAVFDSPDKARAVPLGRIDLTVCAECGFAYNRAFDTKLAQIGAELEVGFESSQSASGHFRKFAGGLATDWVERYHLQGKTVVEVGSGGGDFMNELVCAGVGKVIGVDPLTPRHRANSNSEVLNETFGLQHLTLDAEGLICRHMLEHVPDVKVFLLLVREWAAHQTGRVVLFELPSAERVIKEAAFWDVYYEHCNYFTPGTLRRAFEQAGLRLLRLDMAYGGQYFLVEAIANHGSGAMDWPSASNEVLAWHNFGTRARAAIQRCRIMFDRLADEGGTVVLWQGAAKSVGVLAATGTTSSIDCAVDLSPGRQGRYLPGSGLAVHAPSTLVSLQPRHIVLMNPVYYKEVRAQLDLLGVYGRLWAINELMQ